MYLYYNDRQPTFFPPGGGGPGAGPGGFPPPPPMGGQQGGGQPPPPPPSIIPEKTTAYLAKQPGGVSIYAVDPGAIRPCRYQYVYIWLENGQQFWAWLTYVGRYSAAGWRWTGYRWVYFGVDLRRIDSFVCY